MSAPNASISRSEEMAAALLRGHDETGLDLGDECQTDDWLRAAMYTDGQICIYGRAAIESARARLQLRNKASRADADA